MRGQIELGVAERMRISRHGSYHPLPEWLDTKIILSRTQMRRLALHILFERFQGVQQRRTSVIEEGNGVALIAAGAAPPAALGGAPPLSAAAPSPVFPAAALLLVAGGVVALLLVLVPAPIAALVLRVLVLALEGFGERSSESESAL